MSPKQEIRRRFVFLTFGLEKEYPPRRYQREQPPVRETLIEPQAAERCRRNILALSSVVVLAAMAGIGPRDIEVLGVGLAENRGAFVICGAIVAAQAYWYLMRYLHLRDNAKRQGSTPHGQLNPTDQKIDWSLPWRDCDCLVPRKADLWANRVALALVIVSCVVILSWVV